MQLQAEDMIVLHLLRKRIPSIPGAFSRNGISLRRTYEFRDTISREWNLNLINAIPKQSVPAQELLLASCIATIPQNAANSAKSIPLLNALRPYETWFTGLRREQSATRKNLKKAELHRLPTGETLTQS